MVSKKAWQAGKHGKPKGMRNAKGRGDHSSILAICKQLCIQEDLHSFEIFEQAVRSGGALSMNDFRADLRHRLQGVWREAELSLLPTNLGMLLHLHAPLV
eukprot:1140005-Pelagomonas_calceolata.AAC.2